MEDQANAGMPAQSEATAVAAMDQGGDPNVASSEADSAAKLEQVTADRNAENLARARENGYQDEEAPSLTERAHALVASMEHAMAHNAPVARDMLAEVKALLGIA